MSHLLDVITNGLTPASELKNFFMRRRTPYMTNVLRLDPDTKRNLFFDLKYSDYIVDHLFLTNESINDLELLCSSAFDLIKKVNLVADLIIFKDKQHCEAKKDISSPLSRRACLSTLPSIVGGVGKGVIFR